VPGILSALVTVAFRQIIQGLEWLLTRHRGSRVEIAMALPPWEGLRLPVAGGLVGGLLLQEVGRRLPGPRTTDYMEAIAVGDGWIIAATIFVAEKDGRARNGFAAQSSTMPAQQSRLQSTR
jgi:hypothetical protein